MGGRQRVIAAPVVGCYPEALTQRWILNTSISLQDKTRFAGTLEAAQCVQTVSVLTDALHGALVDIFTVSAVESFISLGTSRAIVFHNVLFD